MNCSMDYMIDALKINDALSKLYEENVAISKKRRNEPEGIVEKQRKMIKDQGDILEDGINYIILCGARELKVTRRWGGV
jgi:transcription initiation factor IIE alpha subunit